MKRIIICVFLIKFVFAKNYLIEVEDEAGNKEVKDTEVDEPEGPHSDYSLKTEQLGLLSIYFLDYLRAYFKTTRDSYMHRIIVDIIRDGGNEPRIRDGGNEPRIRDGGNEPRNDPRNNPKNDPKNDPRNDPRGTTSGRVK